ncbi:MAG: ATP-binding cassette domain-containing protein [Candidatus Nanohaloarchaea archaeon]|nr:ATP-binding cassette domain-containing protein [Candidatus Nanohaloarchaea archaeon]
MSMIQAEDLRKTFRVYRRGEGLKGYLKSFVSREYEDVEAVKGIDLSIDEGEMVGYIGPNGAGKSTTVKMLTGILEPSSGSVEVNGRDPHRNRRENAMDIGVVFGQKTQLWWDLPVRDSFRLLREIYEVDREVYEERIEEFTDVLDLESFMDQPVRKLSLGQKMRCELAAAFLHHPPVVYLDEPTIGLDVSVKEKIRQFIKRMNREEDITMLLTSHDLDDIEDLCDRLLVLDDGRVIYDGTIDELLERFTERRLILDGVEEEVGEDAEGVMEVEQENGTAEVVFDRSKVSASDLIQDFLERYDVSDVHIKEPDINEVVKRIYDEGV